MRSGWLAVLVLAGACSFQPGNGAATGDANRDGAPHADTRATDGRTPDSGSADCAFSRHVDVCAIAGSDTGLGSGLEINANTVFDTDTGTFSITPIGAFTVHLDQAQIVGGQRVTVLAVASLTVDDNKQLVAEGTLPLVIYSLADMSIAGPVDASSHNNDPTQYAGSTGCSGDPRGGGNGDPSNQEESNGGGGGGGAAFGGAGGTGGQSNGSLGGGAGVAVGVPDEILGGCPGGNGGPSFAGNVASGGRGGGALELVAPGTIRLTMHGQVLAGGGGGDGGGDTGANDGGAGGGGAGGYVGLGAGSAIVLDSGAVIAANGGGGGGAAANPGSPGADGGPNATPAMGGPGKDGASNANGGNGGASASAMSAAGGSPDASDDGAAGGGGGTGFILLHGTVSATGATMSPEPVDI